MASENQALQRLANQMQQHLQANAAVIAVAMMGSLVQERQDAWSDLDLLIVVEESVRDRFYPTLAWLQPFGGVFACAQSASPFASVTRVCFADFRRLDCVITTEAALVRLTEWPQVPFWSGTQLLFSRSDAVTEILARMHERPHPGAFTSEQFRQMHQRFWFGGVAATAKVVRGDVLIALHLALDLLRDCCVLAMLLRDRETGAVIHRDSALGQAFVARIASASQPFTASGILSMIEQAAIAFDELSSQWSPNYEAHCQPLLQALDRARQTIVD